MTLFHYKEQHDIIFSADEERLELSSSGLTGRRSAIELFMLARADSNRQPCAYKAPALTIELLTILLLA